ncbi:atrial natriuretic peptide receptor 1 [Melanaphis sacchari]|uniref:atrial natriuretic peptide receptor 1 n=1 Tax=Melanaphis sacchari TaxID=742174 RepID=UPI000DC14058|nr:atrial natriuretic peptide receptor 1 [Melanaphis sacchari]
MTTIYAPTSSTAYSAYCRVCFAPVASPSAVLAVREQTHRRKRLPPTMTRGPIAVPVVPSIPFIPSPSPSPSASSSWSSSSSSSSSSSWSSWSSLSSLSLLLLLLLSSTCAAGSTAVGLLRPVEIRAAVILPADPKFIITLSKVMPVLDIAVRDLYARGILRETDVTFRFMQKDDKCEDIEAMRSGFELIINGRVDLFLGPTCDYGVDLVARMIKFWNAPLLTTGGFTNDFSLDKRDPKSKYFLLVRTGMLDFQDIADVVVSVLNRGFSDICGKMYYSYTTLMAIGECLESNLVD